MRGKFAASAKHKDHRAVGAGHAPPATFRLQQHNGSFVGAAYMPPAAATPDDAS